MEFYTTAAQEQKLKRRFEEALTKKQAELDVESAKNTKRIQKYTARKFVLRPDRVFVVREDGAVEYEDGSRMPTEPQEGGEIYKMDQQCKFMIDAFCEKYATYKVHFLPDGKYGTGVDYYAPRYVYPAILKSLDSKDEVVAHDDAKYDLVCL